MANARKDPGQDLKNRPDMPKGPIEGNVEPSGSTPMSAEEYQAAQKFVLDCLKVKATKSGSYLLPSIPGNFTVPMKVWAANELSAEVIKHRKFGGYLLSLERSLRASAKANKAAENRARNSSSPVKRAVAEYLIAIGFDPLSARFPLEVQAHTQLYVGWMTAKGSPFDPDFIYKAGWSPAEVLPHILPELPTVEQYAEQRLIDAGQLPPREPLKPYLGVDKDLVLNRDNQDSVEKTPEDV